MREIVAGDDQRPAAGHQHPSDRQSGEAVRDQAEHGARADGRLAQHDDPPRAQTVAQLPAGALQRDRGDEVRRHQGLRDRRPRVPEVSGDVRDGDRDHRGVQRHEARGQPGCEQTPCYPVVGRVIHA
jgi:hypothetical protein